MRPVTLNPHDPVSALREIQRASHEADLVEIAQNFSVGNAPAAQRVLNGSSVQLSAAGIGNGADTTDDTLFSYTLPAGALSMVGQALSIRGFGTLANNANNKRASFFFGAGRIGSTNIITTANVSWLIRLTVFKTGPSTQFLVSETMVSSITSNVVCRAVSETDTAPIVIKLVGASTTTGAANDVVANGMTLSAYEADIADVFATFISDCQKGGMNRTT